MLEINYHAGFGTVGLFHLGYCGVVHGNLGAETGLAVVGCQLCGFQQSHIADWFIKFLFDDDMTAWIFLRVEPYIIFAGSL